MTEEHLLYWIWLSLICPPGGSLGDILTDGLESDIELIYKADDETYKRIGVTRAPDLNALADKSMVQASEILSYCKNNGINVLCPESDTYPPRLRGIQRKPLILYVRGTLPDLEDNVCIAMVGTRHMTEYGSHAAYTLSHDMARAGAVIVSGMAKGIDGMSHRGCLDAGGKTVAVFGCGIDRAYPSEHAGLMQEIIRHGAVISEFRPFTRPEGRNFPLRNRIISGLCQGTVVVEADEKSGALITARDALMQGRDLFAVPGKLGELNSLGTNALIRSGAKIATEAYDILAEYEPLYRHRIDLTALPSFRSRIEARRPFGTGGSQPHPAAASDKAVLSPERFRKITEPVTPPDALQTADAGKAPATGASADAPETVSREPLELTEAEQKLYDVMSGTAGMTMDEIARLASVEVSEVMVNMTMMEIKQAVKALPGGLFIRL